MSSTESSKANPKKLGHTDDGKPWLGYLEKLQAQASSFLMGCQLRHKHRGPRSSQVQNWNVLCVYRVCSCLPKGTDRHTEYNQGSANTLKLQSFRNDRTGDPCYSWRTEWRKHEGCCGIPSILWSRPIMTTQYWHPRSVKVEFTDTENDCRESGNIIAYWRQT